MNNEPRILTLNIKPNVVKRLKTDYNIYEGSLGKLIDTKNRKDQLKYCLLNHNFPANIHEYDVIIVDLGYVEKDDYNRDTNTRTINKTNNNTYLLCEYPQTLFDSRAFSSHILKEQILEMTKRASLLIVFQGENEDINYKIVEENGNYPRYLEENEFSIYELIPNFPFLNNKKGVETKVLAKSSELNSFLSKYNSSFTYNLVLNHPKIWDNSTGKDDVNFIPLVFNKNDEIISYYNENDNLGIFVFPQLEDYSTFLEDFLENVAPNLFPTLFPYSTENLWTNKKEYFLPNHQNLIEEKRLLFDKWEKENKKKEQEIQLNYEKFEFLHKIITKTGRELVENTLTYLKWLGFSDIRDMDEINSTLPEEDIQVSDTEGLLVIEVKGISGTSKDSECSQISKIKYRRSKERNSFDVFGLYIVNHQRYLPPNKRKNPPFTSEQISDAENDERGLLTTFQLFNLYFDIEDGIITKEEARKLFFKYGYIKFIPPDLKFICIIHEIYQSGYVSILNIENTKISVGQKLYIENNERYRIANIIEIRSNDKSLMSVENGEVGIKTDIIIKKNSKVWIKNLP